MRDRKIQRALRRDGITKEQLLSRRDFCGIRDPTPYEAIKNIIDRDDGAYEQRFRDKSRPSLP